jgi:hemolysin III
MARTGNDVFAPASASQFAPVRVVTAAEEVANGLTHAFGLLLSIIGLFALIWFALQEGDLMHITSAGVFGGSLVFMYAASTLYHSFRRPDLKHVFRIIDHVSIYFLIAGSYTPFLLVHFQGWLQSALLMAIWTLALAGTAFKLFFTGRFVLLSTLFYVLMGWLVVIALEPFLRAVPTECVLWLLSGGLLYTGGVVFFLWERLPYNHAIWHLFVLGGSACHYTAVLLYVMPV